MNQTIPRNILAIFLLSLILADSLLVFAKPKPVKRAGAAKKADETESNLAYFHDAQQEAVPSFSDHPADSGSFDGFGNTEGADPWARTDEVPAATQAEPPIDTEHLNTKLHEIAQMTDSGNCMAARDEASKIISETLTIGCFGKALFVRARASICIGERNALHSSISDLSDALICIQASGRSKFSDLDKGLNAVGEVHYHRGQAYANLNHFDSAISDASTALRIIENAKIDDEKRRVATVNYLKLRAGMYERKRYRLKNTEDLRRIAELEPSRDNWFELAQRDIHNRTIAVEDYMKALSFDPTNSRIWHFMGHIEYIRGELDRATSAFTTALEHNPREEVHLVWGQMLNEAGRYSEAYQRLSNCAYPRSTLSVRDGARCNHMAGHAMAALGKFRAAIRHYDTAIQLEPERKTSQTGYMREFAMFFHHHLEESHADYVQDQEMDAHWLDGWSSASSSMNAEEQLSKHVPLPPFNPNIPDVEDEMFRIDPKTKRIVGPLGTLIEAADRFISFYRLRSPGFLPNVRVLRGHTLAVLEVAQQIRKVLTSETPIQVSNRGASGGCTGGFHNSENGMGVGFAPGRCVGMTHDFGWRDAFDIAVKWRAITGPGETVHWCDTQLAYKTDQFLRGGGFGETKMADGDVTSHKYYAYFPRMFDRLKHEAAKFKPDNSYESNKQLDEMFKAKTIMEFMKAIKIPRYQVEMSIRNPANLGERLKGTRICLDPSREEYGHFLVIRTMRERERVDMYNKALMAVWDLYLAAGRAMFRIKDLTSPERYELKKQLIAHGMGMVYLYINMMPLNRGSAGSSLTAFQGLLLAAGVEATNKMPELAQPDFEALLTEDPRDYVRLMTEWLWPDGIPMEDSTLLDEIPDLREVLSTTRHVFAALNQIVKVMPVE